MTKEMLEAGGKVLFECFSEELTPEECEELAGLVYGEMVDADEGADAMEEALTAHLINPREPIDRVRGVDPDLARYVENTARAIKAAEARVKADIERVARAICAADGETWPTEWDASEEVKATGLRHRLELGRAVIDTMRTDQ